MDLSLSPLKAAGGLVERFFCETHFRNLPQVEEILRPCQ